MDRKSVITLYPLVVSFFKSGARTPEFPLHYRPSAAPLICALSLLLTTSPSEAWVVDVQSAVNIGGKQEYASPLEIVRIPILDVSPSIGIDLGLIGGGASGHADIEARFVVGTDSSFDLASKANARSFMFTAAPQPTVGDSFFLINQIDSLGIQKLNIHSDGFQAFAGVHADIGGSLWGKACALVFCAKANLGLKVNSLLPLAEISSSGLSVFGSKVDNTDPYTFSGFGGLATASAGIPTFSKTFSNLAPGQKAAMSRQESALYASLDLAGLVARAAGWPPLKGDKFGFGYEILSLTAFAGMDVEHAFSLKPLDLKTVYSFSSPVEYFDKGANAWSTPVSTLMMGDNQSIELRSKDASSIGISRDYQLDYKLDYDFDLLLNAGLDFRALELHGLGLSLGPLIDPAPWKIPLGDFDIDSGSKIGTLTSKGGTSNISFQTQKIIPGHDGVGMVVDLCALQPGGCEQTGYVTDRVDMGGYTRETTYRVLNFGSVGCDGLLLIDCIVDPDFPALVNQVRDGPSDAARRTDELLVLLEELGLSDLFPDLDGSAEVMEYAGDFDQLLDFLTAAPLVEGAASSPDLMLASLQEIGVDPDNPFPPRVPLTGAPPLKEGDLTEDLTASLIFVVPEPGTFYLSALAGLIIAAARRRPSRRDRCERVKKK